MESVGQSHASAFLFADLRDYTAFVERNGDQAAAELLTAFRGLVRAAVERYDGAEIRTEGDSFFIVFTSASAAIRCGLAMSDAARQATERDPSRPIRPGIGIHAGETVENAEGAVGGAVNIAARVAALARPYEVLVTATVRGLTRTSLPFGFASMGARRLKGVAEPVQLYRVVPEGDVATTSSRMWDRVSGRTGRLIAAAVIGVVVIVATYDVAGSLSAPRQTSPASAAAALPTPTAAHGAATAGVVSGTPSSLPSLTGEASTPSARLAPAMVDIPGDGVLLFGGISGTSMRGGSDLDIWKFTLADGWTRLDGEIPIADSSPGYQSLGRPVYVAGTGKVYLYGDTDKGSEIWSYDPLDPRPSVAWQPEVYSWLVTPYSPSFPPDRVQIAEAQVASDPDARKMLVFGGRLRDWPKATGDVMLYNFDRSLVQLDTIGLVVPSPRSGASIGFDAGSGQAVLFGGFGPDAPMQDTWVFDFGSETWTEKSPPSPPSPRYHVGMTYDSAGDRMILFGGRGVVSNANLGGGGPLNDTWSYQPESNVWQELRPANAPTRREMPGFVYDVDSGMAVLFGGGWIGSRYQSFETGPESGTLETLGDTWLYDPAANTWTEWSPQTK